MGNTKEKSNLGFNKKMNYIGGEGVAVGSKKIWTNPREVKDKLREVFVAETIRSRNRSSHVEGHKEWGISMESAMNSQLDWRGIGEINHVQMDDKYSPGMLFISRDNCIGGVYCLDSFGPCWDEVPHRKLNNEEVQKARLAELVQVYKHRVYTKVPIQECINEAGKNPISVRLLGINTGDEDNWEYRGRLVAR